MTGLHVGMALVGMAVVCALIIGATVFVYMDDRRIDRDKAAGRQAFFDGLPFCSHWPIGKQLGWISAGLKAVQERRK